MKKKKVIKGWMDEVGWASFCSEPFHRDKVDLLAYEVRGSKSDWRPDDWPPLKVKVTVEVM